MVGQYLTTVGTTCPVRNTEACLRSSTTSEVSCAKALSSRKYFNCKQLKLYKFGHTGRPLATRPLRPLQARTVSAGIGDTLPKEYSDIPKQPPKGRRAGVVLHPTSLPGPYGMGEIGYEAFRFLDWLKSADMQVWQVLPLVPPGRPIPGVREDYWSPYSGQDASAGNSLLISLHGLVELGLLDASDLPAPVPVGDVDWNYVVDEKEPCLEKAAKNLLASTNSLKDEFDDWCKNPVTAAWLDDAALFSAISGTADLLGMNWWDWPEDLRDRDAAALAKMESTCAEEILVYKVLQFLFEKQWLSVKAYAKKLGISILGDMPIYVGGHSADVWANRQLFTLNEDGEAELVSGVPPDAFSSTGQLWGSPLYDWAAHDAEGYDWWCRRMGRALLIYDEVRIDHFRALAGYWAVDAEEETAMNGVWKVGPGVRLFEAFKEKLGDAKLIAEDLGVITPDVVALREEIGAPGMLVLQFAWEGGGTNVHLPHNHYPNSICYPGTHDNDTAAGWWASANDKAKTAFTRYTGVQDAAEVPSKMIELGMSSVSKDCIMIMQDVIGLDGSARFNTPGTADGNWIWRCTSFDNFTAEAENLVALCKVTDRAPPGKYDNEDD